MIKRLFVISLLLVCALFALPAYAARTFTFSYPGYGPYAFTPASCAGVAAVFGSNASKVNCNSAELDAAMKQTPGQFHFSVTGVWPTQTATVSSSGTCTAGAGGTYLIPMGYVSDSTGKVVQLFPDPVGEKFAKDGCEMVISSEVTPINCVAAGGGNAPAGVHAASCYYQSQITGVKAGVDSNPDASIPDYTAPPPSCTNGATDYPTCTPPTPPTCSNGGTDYPTCTPPGTGGGGTDPGTGGGGTDPGSGGGGTDPGTGGGGTDPGTGGGGTGGGTGSDFCGKHPQSLICLNSGVSGSCANFACTGDAIQCATLREVHEANCKIAADEAAADGSGIGKLGKGVLDGNDPDADKLPTPGNGDRISMPSLDASGWLGGGDCFADKSISVMGKQIVIPFSRACSALIVFRYAIMIVAALSSFKMVSGAILRG
ncbi:virulence factor TspB C-terminal domain-related protein [Duganella sp. PWIR1]